MSIYDAFIEILEDAKPCEAAFVSLYRRKSWYGGPEEGGWYGETISLEFSKRYPDKEEAEAAKELVDGKAKEMTAEANEAWARRCANDMEWLEERGLEPDFLPEIDGPDEYFVRVETRKGFFEREDSRHWS
jgi:hypothetical protein